MHQSTDLQTDLDAAIRRVLAAAPDAAEVRRLAEELSATGHRITAAIETAYLDLTCEDEEAA